MGMTLGLHVIAGGLGLAAGAVALSVAKGSKLHRLSGITFVWVMLVMSGSGAVMATVGAVEASVIAGLLTAYLVVTALWAVRRPANGYRWTETLAMLAALALGAASVSLGVESIVAGDGVRDGIPAGVFLMFGVVALWAGVSDVRVLGARGVAGSRRLARHLWRMCFAFYIASSSFFLGQADEIPDTFQISWLLTILALLPLAAMVYWLWRVRIGGSAWRSREALPPEKI